MDLPFVLFETNLNLSSIITGIGDKRRGNLSLRWENFLEID